MLWSMHSAVDLVTSDWLKLHDRVQTALCTSQCVLHQRDLRISLHSHRELNLQAVNSYKDSHKLTADMDA